MRNNITLRIFVTLFFISLLYFSFRGEMGEIVQILKKTRPFYFLLGFLLQIVAIGMISARLKLIFNARGLSLPLGEAVELSFLGIFFNNFLPTAAGGDLPKAYYAYKKTKKKMESFACVLGDRIIGLFSLVLMAFISASFLWGELNRSVKTAVVSLFFISFLFVLFLFNRRLAKSLRFLLSPLERIGWIKKIEEVYSFLHSMSRDKKLLFRALLITVVAQIVAITSAFILIRGLSASESLIRLFVFFPLISTLSMLPSLNGLGIREGAFVYFLGGSIGKGSALALSILWLATLGMQSIIGGIYYLVHGWRQISLKEIKTLQGG